MFAKFSLATVLELLGLAQRIFQSGKLQAVYEGFKRVLADNGIEADNAELDAVILDAAVRQAEAAKEKTATE